MAERVRTLRVGRQWTQEDLARRAGMSRGYLARLETGRHDPSLSTLVQLARALRVKVCALLD